jgi:hypothetical protein
MESNKGPFNLNGPLFDGWAWDWLSLILFRNSCTVGDVRHWRAVKDEDTDAGQVSILRPSLRRATQNKDDGWDDA